MDVRLAATVEQRTGLLLRETRHSYHLAWSELERSYERAGSRIDELFAAYDEFIRSVLGRSDVSVVAADPGWDLVLIIDEEHDGTLELVFEVEPISPGEAAAPSDAVGRGAPAAGWGDPFG